MVEREIAESYAAVKGRSQSLLTLGPFEVTVASPKDWARLSLSTPVFSGGNYLPGSVRACVADSGLTVAGAGASASLLIDEASFQVILEVATPWESEDRQAFEQMVGDFVSLAEEWRKLLDEYGQQDLIHVPR